MAVRRNPSCRKSKILAAPIAASKIVEIVVVNRVWSGSDVCAVTPQASVFLNQGYLTALFALSIENIAFVHRCYNVGKRPPRVGLVGVSSGTYGNDVRVCSRVVYGFLVRAHNSISHVIFSVAVYGALIVKNSSCVAFTGSIMIFRPLPHLAGSPTNFATAG